MSERPTSPDDAPPNWTVAAFTLMAGLAVAGCVMFAAVLLILAGDGVNGMIEAWRSV